MIYFFPNVISYFFHSTLIIFCLLPVFIKMSYGLFYIIFYQLTILKDLRTCITIKKDKYIFVSSVTFKIYKNKETYLLYVCKKKVYIIILLKKKTTKTKTSWLTDGSDIRSISKTQINRFLRRRRDLNFNNWWQTRAHFRHLTGIRPRLLLHRNATPIDGVCPAATRHPGTHVVRLPLCRRTHATVAIAAYNHRLLALLRAAAFPFFAKFVFFFFRRDRKIGRLLDYNVGRAEAFR